MSQMAAINSATTRTAKRIRPSRRCLRSDRRGFYSYSASYTDSGFTITASYSGPPNGEAPQSLSVDENLQVR